MARGTSIHIGVNRPAAAHECTLGHSEANAWKMAELASQAGYGAIHVLRGAHATWGAVLRVLDGAVRALEEGHTLFVTFNGHGSHARDRDGDERDGWDETWCLHDGHLVDDELVKIWRQAAAGTRIVVVTESCFSGGMGRDGKVEDVRLPHASPAPYRPVYRSGGLVTRGVKQFAEAPSSCISRVPVHDDGIRACLLVMTASAEERKAREGLYIGHLLDLWSRGTFDGSFCELHEKLRDRVRHENQDQEPQILMLGTADSAFPKERAFHLERPATRGGGRDGGRTRGG